MKLTIGADPETFVTDEDGKIICAHGLVPGTKEEPYIVEGGALQVDGMALEFNIDPVPLVKGGSEAFCSAIFSVKKILLATAGKAQSKVSYHKFPKEYFDAQPEEAKEMGCDPDQNAWTEVDNPGPPEGLTSRAVGGHIHIGWGEGFDIRDEDHVSMCREIVKQLDVILGLNSVLEDKGTERRKLYGSAGSFRPKPYGVEYRSLSNYWIFDKDLCAKVYDRCYQAVTDLIEGDRYWLDADSTEDIRSAINYSDEWMAEECLTETLL